jgi:hypothetical protein
VDSQKPDDTPAEVLNLSTYRQEEDVFQSSEEPGLAPTVGDRKIVSKLWRSFEVALATSEGMICTSMFLRSSRTSSPDPV